MSSQSRTLQLLGIPALASMVACASARERREAQPAQYEYRGGAVEAGQRESNEGQVVRGNPPMGVKPDLELIESDPPKWRVTSVVIDVGVAELCGLDAAQTNFDYDSAKLDEGAKATIAALADCFVNGPLAGREVVVIGHTDPRGPDDYNRELGMSRADAVAQALTREGLATTRIDVESHGEAQAHADPDEWPDDRRVDINVSG